MKKHIALILTAVLVLNLCPSLGAGVFSNIIDVHADSANDKPVPIYRADDFETQVIGSFGNGFWERGGITKEFFTSGEEFEKDGNANNKAIAFSPGSTLPIIPFVGAPLEYDFVLDFSYNIATSNKINIGIRYDIENLEREKYLTQVADIDGDGKNDISDHTKSGVITLNKTNVTFNGTTIAQNIDASEWHRFQMHVDKETFKTAIYIDKNLISDTLTFPTFENITEFRFELPSTGKYYLDDLKVYLSDRILTDAEFASDLAEYKNSGLMPEARYSTGRQNVNAPFIFNMFYDEFVMAEGGRRIWRNDRFYELPINMLLENGKTYVPLRAFSEMMGATVDYNTGVITVSMNGNTLTLTEGSKIYYVNGKAAKLAEPIRIIEGYAVVNLDVLCNFFGIDYKSIKDVTAVGTESYALISFSGDIQDDYPVFGSDNSASSFGEERTNYEDRLIRMYELLKIHLPSAEELLDLYSKNFAKGKHPRYLITDFEELKLGLEKGDSTYKLAVAKYLNKAETALTSNIVTLDSAEPKNNKWVSSYDAAMKVSFAWNMTGEQKYLDWVNTQIDNLYTFMENTNLSQLTTLNGLTNANAIHGVAIMYDWMYNDLDEDRREKLGEVVKKLGVDLHDYLFRSAYTSALSTDYGYGNQVLIRGCGIMAACLAVIDEYSLESSRVLQQVLRIMVNPFGDFYPSGGYAEGISYWAYTMDTMPLVINGLENAFGTHFGYYDLPGVRHTTDYPLSILGATGTAYPTGDGDDSSPWHPSYMFEANMNNDKAKAMQYRSHINGDIKEIINWIFMTPEEEIEAATLPTDVYMNKLENVILKTGNETTDTSILLHGGGVNDGHGHEDCGQIQFDMLGYRWGADLGREDYNLYQFGDYVGRDSANPSKAYTGYSAYDYYRDNAEGHNTVFAGLGDNRFRMKTQGHTKFIDYEFSDTKSYGILDMTDTNENFDSAVRGVKLNKAQNEIIIHDLFQSKEATDFHWGMHTEADVEVAEDGKSAILSRDNGAIRIWMGIINDCDYVIKDMPAVPYVNDKVLLGAELNQDSVMRPTGYANKMVRPPLESTVIEPFKATGFATAVKEGYSRLTIETSEDTTEFNVMVAFKPLAAGQNVPLVMPDSSPMETWKSNKNANIAQADMIKVDGVNLDGFEPSKFNYEIQSDTMPVITAAANAKYDVEVISPKALPGIAMVLLKEQEKISSIYYIKINHNN